MPLPVDFVLYSIVDLHALMNSGNIPENHSNLLLNLTIAIKLSAFLKNSFVNHYFCCLVISGVGPSLVKLNSTSYRPIVCYTLLGIIMAGKVAVLA